MSVHARSNATGLMAFLLWNALLNAIHRSVKQSWTVMQAYWLATQEWYAKMIGGNGEINVNFPGSNIKNSLIGDLLGVAIIFIFSASLIGPIANATTGITIAHSGFTPNPNVTQSVGLVPATQLFPLVFVALILFGGFRVLERHTPGAL